MSLSECRLVRWCMWVVGDRGIILVGCGQSTRTGAEEWRSDERGGELDLEAARCQLSTAVHMFITAVRLEYAALASLYVRMIVDR